MANLAEIADGIFRVNLVIPGRAVTYSFFVLKGDEPTLVETSFGQYFDELREAVARVIDPTTIRHILVPHFEGDECGAMNQFLALAPHAEVIGSRTAQGSLGSFAIRPPRAVDEGDLLDIGGKRLRIVLTPQVHQWEALMAFEETTSTLFSSDLFIQPGDGPAITEQDLTEQMVAHYRRGGVMPSMPHLHAALDKIEPLNVQRIACHHGSTIAGAVVPRYFQAIRDHDITAFGTD
jgi:flavorubredoxin